MFENLKENIQKRVEKNCIKVNIQGEEVILKKSRIPLISDWGRIYPPVNEDGSWNKLNLLFGGKKNLIKLILIMLFLSLVYVGISDLVGSCKDVAVNPCEYCPYYKNANMGGEPLLYQSKLDSIELEKKAQEISKEE